MKKNTIVGLVVLAILLILATSWYFIKGKNGDFMSPDSTQTTAPKDDALDVSLDFFKAWLSASQSTSTDPYQSGLLDSAALSPEAKAQIEQRHTDFKEGDLEPVLCQTATPKRVGAKEIFTTDTNAQVMILARGGETKSPYQSIVSLSVVDGAWKIKSIDCSQGETAPESEFDFEHSGNLLKESIQAPYSNQNWHLVYEVNGEKGHVAPLFFTPESICVAYDGSEAPCDLAEFKEGMQVLVQASMSEEGGTVEKLTFQK